MRQRGLVEAPPRGEDCCKEEDEAFEKWKRTKSMVWRKLEDRNEEEKEVKLRRIMERVLGKEGKIIMVKDRRVEERGN